MRPDDREKKSQEVGDQRALQTEFEPWPGGSVGYSIVLMCQGCRFSSWLEHMQEAINEGMDKLEQQINVSLSQINFFKKEPEFEPRNSGSHNSLCS